MVGSSCGRLSQIRIMKASGAAYSSLLVHWCSGGNRKSGEGWLRLQARVAEFPKEDVDRKEQPVKVAVESGERDELLCPCSEVAA